jgi:hypothetical protein
MQQSSSLIDYSSSMEIAAVKSRSSQKSLAWAYRLYWITLCLFLASTGAGKLWDRVWHATHRFDTFWSPPHLFVFIMTLIAGLVVAGIAFTPSLQVWYGPLVRVPIIRWNVAGTLVVLGAGLVALSITVLLDNAWHTAFGLDETQWSVPHSMLGWSWLIVVLGFVAARLAFQEHRPINWLTKMFMACMLMEFLTPAILGPFYLMYSPNLVHALASIPVVLTEPSAQHMYRIYLHYGLTRQTNVLFIPLVALFAGVALAMLRALDKRARIFLMAPVVWSITLMARDLYTILFLHYDGAKHITDIIPIALKEPSLWVPIPIVIGALTFMALEHTSFSSRYRYAIMGVVFGLFTFLIWHNSPWMIFLAIPAGLTAALGSWIGEWIYGLLEAPTFIGLMKLVLICCAQIPAVSGVIDLFMRRTTF